ncbi:hypothetical protein Tco_1454162 [Tanacetum coccineum]
MKFHQSIKIDQEGQRFEMVEKLVEMVGWRLLRWCYDGEMLEELAFAFQLSKQSITSYRKVSWWKGWFKVHESGELGGVVNKNALGAKGDALIGEDSFDDILMTFVLASFLGGFLVDEEALEAILDGELKEITTPNGKMLTVEPAGMVPSARGNRPLLQMEPTSAT